MGTIKEESNPFSDEAKKIVQEILEEMLVRVLEKPEYEQQMVNHLSIHLYIRELEIIEDICTSLFSLSLSQDVDNDDDEQQPPPVEADKQPPAGEQQMVNRYLCSRKSTGFEVLQANAFVHVFFLSLSFLG